MAILFSHSRYLTIQTKELNLTKKLPICGVLIAPEGESRWKLQTFVIRTHISTIFTVIKMCACVDKNNQPIHVVYTQSKRAIGVWAFLTITFWD